MPTFRAKLEANETRVRSRSNESSGPVTHWNLRFNVIVAQVVFILLSYTLRQWQLWKFRQQDLAGKTPGLLGRQLNLHSEHVVIYYQNAYTRMPLLTFSRELLELPAQARARALKRLRHLEKSFLTPLENLRAPP
jgi:hypothetical protein